MFGSIYNITKNHVHVFEKNNHFLLPSLNDLHTMLDFSAKVCERCKKKHNNHTLQNNLMLVNVVLALGHRQHGMHIVT
jgi:hypothetical protein